MKQSYKKTLNEIMSGMNISNRPSISTNRMIPGSKPVLPSDRFRKPSRPTQQQTNRATGILRNKLGWKTDQKDPRQNTPLGTSDKGVVLPTPNVSQKGEISPNTIRDINARTSMIKDRSV
ncbi:MAG: hypothetical protein WD512_11560 [Candidatus Paceibacterota bacterium]